MKNDEKFKLTGPEDPSLTNLLREHNVEYSFDRPPNPLGGPVLVYLLPDFVADWFCLLYDAADPAAGIGVMQLAKVGPNCRLMIKKKVTFADVAGQMKLRKNWKRSLSFKTTETVYGYWS